MDNSMVNNIASTEMSDRKNPQIVFTLSETAYNELSRVAEWKKTPLATYIRQIIERHHESTEFMFLLDRVKEFEKRKK